ncbi:MAG: calcium-binding protein, partial [Acidobacteria bacterium]|nr:calcium-binding protein [Acidobacteriota bacterium]
MFSYSNARHHQRRKTGVFSSIVALALLLGVSSAAFAIGNLDRTFGTDGKAITPIGTSADRGYALALQPDGKIVLAGATFSGASFHTAIARYKTDGTLDETFGTGGKVVVNISATNDVANDVAIQSDGKILVAGYAAVGTQS